MTEETDTKHPCKQGPTLAVICEQANGIEKSV